MTAGLIFVCGLPAKLAGEMMFISNPNVTMTLNGRELHKSKMKVFPTGKCVRLLEMFGVDGHEKEDTMLLTFEMAEQDPDLEYRYKPHVELSHVVAL